MFKVSTILEDDSAELVFGGANGFVNVSLSNSATCAFHSTFEELIGEFVASMFGEVLGEGASLSIEVEEEEALAISGGSRFAVKMGDSNLIEKLGAVMAAQSLLEFSATQQTTTLTPSIHHNHTLSFNSHMPTILWACISTLSCLPCAVFQTLDLRGHCDPAWRDPQMVAVRTFACGIISSAGCGGGDCVWDYDLRVKGGDIGATLWRLVHEVLSDRRADTVTFVRGGWGGLVRGGCKGCRVVVVLGGGDFRGDLSGWGLVWVRLFGGGEGWWVEVLRWWILGGVMVVDGGVEFLGRG
ncbi:hypothetical protein Tco_1571063 [Tanacetum coccineum]